MQSKYSNIFMEIGAQALKNETSENILGSLKKEIWHKKKVPIETEEPQSTLPPSTTLTPPTTFTPLPTTIQPTTLPPPTTFTPLPFSTQPLSTILTPTLPSTTSQPNSTPPPTTGACCAPALSYPAFLRTPAFMSDAFLFGRLSSLFPMHGLQCMCMSICSY